MASKDHANDESTSQDTERIDAVTTPPHPLEDDATMSLGTGDWPTATLPADELPTQTVRAGHGVPSALVEPIADVSPDDVLSDWMAQEQAAAAAKAAATAPPSLQPATVTAPAAPSTPTRHGARWSTIVWGLIVAAVGVLLILGSLGLQFNVTFVLIGLLLGAGALLIVGAIATAARRNRS